MVTILYITFRFFLAHWLEERLQNSRAKGSNLAYIEVRTILILIKEGYLYRNIIKSFRSSLAQVWLLYY